MLKTRHLLSGLAAAGLFAAAAPVLAAPSQFGPPLAPADCFRSRDWKGLTVADADTIYIGVNNRSVYKIGLRGGGAHDVDAAGRFLLTVVRGVDRVCSPNDLDLKIADRSTGAVIPLFPVTIEKLSAAEANALPPKLRPISLAAR
jgi:hypothetical protein